MFPAGEFLLYCLVTFGTPGPNTLMSLENGRRKGLKGIWLNMGMLCGQVVVVLLCLAFTKTLYDALPVFQPVMRAVGAGYMLYQAWKCLRRRGAGSKDPGRGDFLTGFAMQFINPKFILVVISILSNYLLPYFTALPALAGMTLLLALLANGCTIVWLAGGAALSRFLARYERAANLVMAGLLVYCAWRIVR